MQKIGGKKKGKSWNFGTRKSAEKRNSHTPDSTNKLGKPNISLSKWLWGKNVASIPTFHLKIRRCKSRLPLLWSSTCCCKHGISESPVANCYLVSVHFFYSESVCDDEWKPCRGWGLLVYGFRGSRDVKGQAWNSVWCVTVISDGVSMVRHRMSMVWCVCS